MYYGFTSWSWRFRSRVTRPPCRKPVPLFTFLFHLVRLARAASKLATLLALPIATCSAIHFKVIGVSCRNRAAMATFRLSPFCAGLARFRRTVPIRDRGRWVCNRLRGRNYFRMVTGNLRFASISGYRLACPPGCGIWTWMPDAGCGPLRCAGRGNEAVPRPDAAARIAAWTIGRAQVRCARRTTRRPGRSRSPRGSP